MIEFTLEISNWNFGNQLTSVTLSLTKIKKYLHSFTSHAIIPQLTEKIE